MILCLCRNVSDRDVSREVKAGCADFATLQQLTGIATGCGRCREFAEEALANQLERHCGACAGAARCGTVPLAAGVPVAV